MGYLRFLNSNFKFGSIFGSIFGSVLDNFWAQKAKNGQIFYFKIVDYLQLFHSIVIEVSKYITDVLVCLTTLIDSLGYLEIQVCILTYSWAYFGPNLGSEGQKIANFFKPLFDSFHSKTLQPGKSYCQLDAGYKKLSFSYIFYHF